MNRCLLLSMAVALALCSSACSYAELNPVYEPPQDLRADVRACTEDPGGAVQQCLYALSVATESADRATVGQVLLAQATAAPQEIQKDILRAGLYLNNGPWVTDNMLPAFQNAGDFVVDNYTDIEGTLVFFDEAQSDSPADGSIFAETALERLDLSIPPVEHPLAGDALAMTVVAAGGGVAAAWSTGRDVPPRVVPAAPLFARLLGAPIGGAEGAWDSAILTGHADWFLRQGRIEMAWERLDRAIALLPEDAPPCTTRGAMLMSALLITSIEDVGNRPEIVSDLTASCLEIEVAESEVLTQRYLAALLEIELHGSTPKSSNAPDLWRTASGRVTYIESIVGTLAADLDGRRAALISTLAQRVFLRAEQQEPCAVEADIEAALDDNDEALRWLGRTDWIVRHAATHLLHADRTPNRPGIRDWIAQMARPENKWIQLDGLAAGVNVVGSSPVLMMDPRAAKPLCEAYFDVALQRIRDDRLEDRAWRNSDRVLDGSFVGWTCGDADRSNELVDAMLGSAGGAEDATQGVVLTVGYSTIHIVSGMLFGRSMSWGRLMVESVATGLERYRGALTDSPEDRVLNALIDVTVTVPDAMLGDFAGLSAALDSAVPVWGEVADGGATAEAPGLVVWSPAFRMGGLATQALADTLQGKDATIALLKLVSTAESDIGLLLQNTGNSQYVAVSTQLVGALRDVTTAVTTASPESWDAAFITLAAASTGSESEQGWWGVGFDGLRMVLWDVLAYTAWSEGWPERADSAFVEAQAITQRLVDRTLAAYGAEGTAWELLRLLGPLHRGLLTALFAPTPEGAGDDPQWDLAMEREGGLFAARLSEALERFQVEPEGEGSRFLILVLVALNQAGAEQVLAGDADAVRRFAEAVSTGAAQLSTATRAWAFLTIGVAQVLSGNDDPTPFAAAHQAFIQSEWLAELAPLALTIEASLMEADGKMGRASAALDAVMASAPASECNAPTSVLAVLPTHARIYERMNKHLEAEAMMALWTAWVQSLEYTGDTRMRCVFTVSEGGVILSADISQLLGMVGTPVSQEGAFQLGAGFTTGDDERGELVCTAKPLDVLRPDLVAEVYSARAWYGLRADDHRAAEAGLVGTTRQVRRMTAAIGAGEPEVELAAQTARMQFDPEMMSWTLASALSSGHVWSASYLQSNIDLAGITRTVGTDTVPAWLEGMDLDDARPLVQALSTTDPTERSQFLDAAKLSAHQRAVVESWLELTGDGVTGGQAAADRLGALDAPADALDPIALAHTSLAMMAATHLGNPPTGAEVQQVVEAYLQADLHAEALIFGRMMINALFFAGDHVGGMAVGDLMLQQVDSTRVPHLYGDFLAELVTVWWNMGNKPSAMQAMDQSLMIALGTLTPQEEFARVFQMFMMLEDSKNRSEIQRHLGIVMPKLLRLDPQGPTAYRLVVASLLLELLEDGVQDKNGIADRINGIMETWAPLNDTETDGLLKQLRGTLDAPDKLEALANSYLEWVFLGKQR